jgi:hypothetical protein
MSLGEWKAHVSQHRRGALWYVLVEFIFGCSVVVRSFALYGSLFPQIRVRQNTLSRAPKIICDLSCKPNGRVYSALMQDTKTVEAGERTQAKFSVGDRVDRVNNAGLRFPGKTVIEVKLNSVRGFTYYITPTDTPWFDTNESNLRPATNAKFAVVRAGEVLKDGDEYQDPHTLDWHPTKSAGRKVGIPNCTTSIYRRAN